VVVEHAGSRGVWVQPQTDCCQGVSASEKFGNRFGRLVTARATDTVGKGVQQALKRSSIVSAAIVGAADERA
jgi:predicted RNA-binding protein YlxR (DUF448 family)